MIKPTKKGKSLSQRLAAKPKQRKGPQSWIDLLPKDIFDEFQSIKKLAKDGKLANGITDAAREVKEEYGSQIEVSVDTVRRWLGE